MPEFLLTGRDEKGERRRQRIKAADADEAIAIMHRRGFVDVAQLADESAPAAASPAASPSAGLRLTWHRPPRWLRAYLGAAARCYRAFWGLLLVMLAVVVLRRILGSPWELMDWIVVASPAGPLLIAAFLMPLRLDPSINGLASLPEAEAWGRWREVLDHVHAMESGEIGLPPEFLAYSKARALAGLGRWEEAVACSKAATVDSALPAWSHLLNYAEVCGVAGRRDDAYAALKRAFAAAPSHARVALRTARWEILERQDAERARRLLALARNAGADEDQRVLTSLVEGLVQLADGQAETARSQLEAALREVSDAEPITAQDGRLMDEIKWALALACAAQGDREAAQRFYGQAKPRLESLKLQHLMERYERAVGRAN